MFVGPVTAASVALDAARWRRPMLACGEQRRQPLAAEPAEPAPGTPWRAAPYVLSIRRIGCNGRESMGEKLLFEDDFDGPELDRGKWLAHYLPHWSRRDRTVPRYDIAGGCLVLRIDPDQPAWCPEFNGGVKVSNLQTGQFSGPPGSPAGQHRFAPGLVVREAQPREELFLFRHGRLELRARADISANNVAALWLIGFEDRPERSGELCVMEIKGWERDADTTLVGYGIKPFHDPALVPEFFEDRLPIDLAAFHVYGIDWSDEGVAFFLDGRLLRRVAQSPAYPMQLMLNLYELPDVPAPPREAPATFTIDWIRVTAPAA